MIDGKKLRELREAANLSQRELAQRVGCSSPLIARAEAEVKDLSLGMAAAIARELGCLIDDFIRKDGAA